LLALPVMGTRYFIWTGPALIEKPAQYIDCAGP